jgi:hypothetical protein
VIGVQYAAFGPPRQQLIVEVAESQHLEQQEQEDDE